VKIVQRETLEEYDRDVLQYEGILNTAVPGKA